MRFSTTSRLIALVLLTLLGAFALPGVAAATGDEAIQDCAQDGDLDKEYSDEELEDAENDMPSDLDAYSNCRDVFRAARSGGGGGLNELGNGGGGGASGGGGNGGANTGPSGTEGATKNDLNEINRREQDARGDIAPPETTLPAAADAGDDSGLPAAALIAIALLGLAAVGGGVYLLRDYLPPGLSSRLPGASR